MSRSPVVSFVISIFNTAGQLQKKPAMRMKQAHKQLADDEEATAEELRSVGCTGIAIIAFFIVLPVVILLLVFFT